jgi:hypothetical protein
MDEATNSPGPPRQASACAAYAGLGNLPTP